MPTSPDWLKSSPSRIRLLSWTLSVLLHLALLYGLYWFATVITFQQDSSKPFQVIVQATLAQSPAPEQEGQEGQAQSQTSASNPANTNPASSPLPVKPPIPKANTQENTKATSKRKINPSPKQTKTKPSAASTPTASKPKPKTIAQTQEQTRAEVAPKNPAQTPKTTPAKAAPNPPPIPDNTIGSNSQASSDAEKTKPSLAPTDTKRNITPKPKPKAQAQSNPNTDTKAATTKTAPSKAASSTSSTNTLQTAQTSDTNTTLQAPVCTGPKPTYPRLSRLRGETGQVRILIWVTPDSGAIQELEVLQSSGFARLDQAALVAARRWRCQAAELAGKPHSGVVEQNFDFGLLD